MVEVRVGEYNRVDLARGNRRVLPVAVAPFFGTLE